MRGNLILNDVYVLHPPNPLRYAHGPTLKGERTHFPLHLPQTKNTENGAFCEGVFGCEHWWWLILVLSKISQNTPCGVFYQ